MGGTTATKSNKLKSIKACRQIQIFVQRQGKNGEKNEVYMRVELNQQA